LDDGLPFFRRERAIVDKLPKTRMRKPWRHALFLDYFGDGFGLGGNFVVGRQRKRRFGPRSVTLDAMLVYQRRDVLRIRDLVGTSAGVLVARLRIGLGRGLFRLRVDRTGRPRQAHDTNPRQQHYGRGPEQSVQRPVTTEHARHFDPFGIESGNRPARPSARALTPPA